jgi:hypothetical protein
MLSYADVWRALEAGLQPLANADVCCRTLTYADVWRALEAGLQPRPPLQQQLSSRVPATRPATGAGNEARLSSRVPATRPATAPGRQLVMHSAERASVCSPRVNSVCSPRVKSGCSPRVKEGLAQLVMHSAEREAHVDALDFSSLSLTLLRESQVYVCVAYA